MTDPIRILHFADVHIGMERYGRVDAATGVNSRVMDYLRRLSDLVDFAIERDVDLVIFAGDAYKTRNPNSTYRREFSWRIKRIADHGIPVVMVAGNHDLPPVSQRASTIEIFDTLRVPNIYVLDQDSGVTLIETKRGPVQIAPAPYPYTSELASQEAFRAASLDELDRRYTEFMSDIIRAMAQEARSRPDIPAVLVGHFSVDGAMFSSERSVMVGRDITVPRAVLVDDAWDYVALGHIHRHQDVNEGAHPPVVYSGSIERIDFGEEKEFKGWVLAQVTRGHADYEFIPHHRREARRFTTIDCDCRQEEDSMEAVLKRIRRRQEEGGVQDAIVRVRLKLRDDQDQLISDRKIRAALANAFAVAGVIRQIDWRVRSRLGAGDFENATPLELLDRYFEQLQTPEDEKQALLEDAARIIQGV
ncbi:MAG TPA: exonuclease SbcCD subunit D [Caldilineae bacterium]|nr:exonuclease SbcCD subunit D [Caldilineae bacterium]HIQ12667.1 exonuclease SbcCD subunit D [Caldilineales bacterium]